MVLHNPLTLHASHRTPTIIELLATERLMPQLREALQYTLAIVAARHPMLLRLHAHADEAWALCCLILESHFLQTADSSFAESFYGICRARVGANGQPQRLTNRQRRLSLLALVLLPYIYAKLAAERARSVERREAAHLRLASARAPLPVITAASAASAVAAADTAGQSQPAAQSTPGSAADAALLRLAALRALARRTAARVRRLLVAAFPAIEAVVEAERFCWQFGHAFGATRQWSTLLAASRMELVRRTAGDELARAERRTEEGAGGTGALIAGLANGSADGSSGGAALPALLAQARELRRLLHASPSRNAAELSRALARALRLSGSMLLEHARHGLVLIVVLIKVLLWWYSPDAASARPAHVRLPPPPPLRPAGAGVQPPAEKGVCPLCRMPRVNATLAPSGYVFCYRCIFGALERGGRCPVTLMPAEVSSLRKVYEAEPS